jgi:hypothetical protein
MFSSKQKTRPELVLILDVQSSLVRGALVLLSAANPEIIFSSECAIPFRVGTDSSFLIKAALKSVGEMTGLCLRYIHAARALKGSTLPKKISAVHYVLSSPWLTSQARTLDVSFPRKTVVTRAYILGMIEKQSNAGLAAAKDKYTVIEQKISDVRLNGYSIAAWEKKEATELSVSCVISIAGRRMSDLFVEACGHVVSGHHVFFHSSLVIQHIGIRLVMPERTSYTLIDIHGELTDITVVHQQSCVFFASIPVGSDTAVRNIAAVTRTDAGTAQSLVNLYMKKALDDANRDKGGQAVDAAGLAWVRELRKALEGSEYADHIPVPLLVPDVDHADFFVRSFDAAYADVAVEKLSVESLRPRVTFGRDAHSGYHVGLDAIAVNNLNTPDR